MNIKVRSIDDLARVINDVLIAANSYVTVKTNRLSLVFTTRHDGFVKESSCVFSQAFYNMIENIIYDSIPGKYSLNYNNTRSSVSLWKNNNQNVFEDDGFLHEPKSLH